MVCKAKNIYPVYPVWWLKARLGALVSYGLISKKSLKCRMQIYSTPKKKGGDAGSSIVSWFIQEDKARESSRISNASQAHSFL